MKQFIKRFHYPNKLRHQTLQDNTSYRTNRDDTQRTGSVLTLNFSWAFDESLDLTWRTFFFWRASNLLKLDFCKRPEGNLTSDGGTNPRESTVSYCTKTRGLLTITLPGTLFPVTGALRWLLVSRLDAANIPFYVALNSNRPCTCKMNNVSTAVVACRQYSSWLLRVLSTEIRTKMIAREIEGTKHHYEVTETWESTKTQKTSERAEKRREKSSTVTSNAENVKYIEGKMRKAVTKWGEAWSRSARGQVTHRRNRADQKYTTEKSTLKSYYSQVKILPSPGRWRPWTHPRCDQRSCPWCKSRSTSTTSNWQNKMSNTCEWYDPEEEDCGAGDANARYEGRNIDN